MKKIIYFVAVLFLLKILNGCGYQPIYSSQNVNLKIVNQYYEGSTDLAQRVYAKINNILFFDNNAKEVDLKIFASKNKSTTSTNSSGNALSYKITLNTELTMTNIFSDQVLANENITLSRLCRADFLEKFTSIMKSNEEDIDRQICFILYIT